MPRSLLMQTAPGGASLSDIEYSHKLLDLMAAEIKATHKSVVEIPADSAEDMDYLRAVCAEHGIQFEEYSRPVRDSYYSPIVVTEGTARIPIRQGITIDIDDHARLVKLEVL